MFDCAAYIMLRYVVHAFILSACSMSIIMHVLAVLHYFMSCMQSLICVCSIQISHNVGHGCEWCVRASLCFIVLHSQQMSWIPTPSSQTMT